MAVGSFANRRAKDKELSKNEAEAVEKLYRDVQFFMSSFACKTRYCLKTPPSVATEHSVPVDTDALSYKDRKEVATDLKKYTLQ